MRALFPGQIVVSYPPLFNFSLRLTISSELLSGTATGRIKSHWQSVGNHLRRSLNIKPLT